MRESLSAYQDRYRFGELLGEGGMGSVYSAVRLCDGVEVAIKVLKVEGVDQARHLVREARIAQRLQHPNVVRVHEIISTSSNEPILVMELLRGESVRQRLSTRPSLSLEAVARILIDVTCALEAAHSIGIVHRDVKPENIFLHRNEADCTVKVLDFGIAKVIGASLLHTAGITQTGTMLGTPCYMAPEQVFGERDIDVSADVWALGVVLFECIAGRRPFEGANSGQIFKAITMQQAPLLDATVPKGVARLVHRMLARERVQRPSLPEVRAELATFAGAETRNVIVRTREPVCELAPTLDAAHLDCDDLMTPAPAEVSQALAGTRSFTRTFVRRSAVAACALALGLGLRGAYAGPSPWARTPRAQPGASAISNLSRSPAATAALVKVVAMRNAAAAAAAPRVSPEAPLRSSPTALNQSSERANSAVRSRQEGIHGALPLVSPPKPPGGANGDASSRSAPPALSLKLPGGVHGDNPY